MRIWILSNLLFELLAIRITNVRKHHEKSLAPTKEQAIRDLLGQVISIRDLSYLLEISNIWLTFNQPLCRTNLMQQLIKISLLQNY
jgi:hypothetical protein